MKEIYEETIFKNKKEWERICYDINFMVFVGGGGWVAYVYGGWLTFMYFLYSLYVLITWIIQDDKKAFVKRKAINMFE